MTISTQLPGLLSSLPLTLSLLIRQFARLHIHAPLCGNLVCMAIRELQDCVARAVARHGTPLVMAAFEAMVDVALRVESNQLGSFVKGILIRNNVKQHTGREARRHKKRRRLQSAGPDLGWWL